MSEARPMPHSEVSEKSILSAFMDEPWRIDEAGLPVEAFHSIPNQTIYREIRGYAHAVDPVVLCERLNEKSLLPQLVSPVQVMDVFGYGKGRFDDHLAIVRDRFARRKAIAACWAAADAAFDCSEGEDSRNYLDALSGPITEVFDIASGSEPEDDTEALAREFTADFEKRLAGEVPVMGTPTGIPDIDENLLGLHRGHMGIISGPPGGGKSTLATQIAANLAEDGVPTLYLAYERGRLSVFRRSIIQGARVPAAVVNNPFANHPTKFDLMHIRDAIHKATPSLHVRTPKNRRAGTCLAEIRRFVRQKGVRVVMIDQIGLLRGDRHRTGTAEEELRLISNSIQELAQELQITIIVLCQVTVDGDTKNARAIEEDADWWLSIILERDKKKPNFGEHQHILLVKDSHNTKGGTRLPLILDKNLLRFVQGVPAAPAAEEKKKSRYN